MRMHNLAGGVWHNAVRLLDWVLPVTSSSNPKHICWTAMMIATTLFMAVDVPLLIAFDEWRDLPVVSKIGWISSSFLCMDVIVNFRTTYITPHGELVRNPRLIATHYLSTTFWLDLLSALPLDEIIESLVRGGIHKHVYWLGLMRLPRLVILLRRLPRMVPAQYFNLVSVARLLLVMVLITHGSACLWYYMSQKLAGLPWAFSIQCNNWSARDRYIYAFYRAFLLILGDRPTAYNNIERCFAVVLLTVGACVYAVVVGSMSLLVSNMWSMASRHKQRAAMVEDVLGYNGVSEEVRNKAYDYFYFMAIHDHPGPEGVALLSELPVPLHSEVLSAVFEPALSKVQLFTHCERAFLWRLAQRLKLSLFMKLDTVYEMGSVGHDMYIVWKGVVALVDPDGGMAALMVDGHHFGELALMAPCIPRPHQAIAVLPTDVMTLSRHDLLEVMRDFPESAQFVQARARIHLEDHEIGPAVWMTALFEEPQPAASSRQAARQPPQQAQQPVNKARRSHPTKNRRRRTPAVATSCARPVSEAAEGDGEALFWQLNTDTQQHQQQADHCSGSCSVSDESLAALLLNSTDWLGADDQPQQQVGRTSAAVGCQGPEPRTTAAAAISTPPISAAAVAATPISIAATAAAAVEATSSRPVHVSHSTPAESATMSVAAAGTVGPCVPRRMDSQVPVRPARGRHGYYRTATGDFGTPAGHSRLLRNIQEAINATGKGASWVGEQQHQHQHQQVTNQVAAITAKSGPTSVYDSLTADAANERYNSGSSVPAAAYSLTGMLLDSVGSVSSAHVMGGHTSILELPPQPFLGKDPLGPLCMAANGSSDFMGSHTQDMWQPPAVSPLLAARVSAASLGGRSDIQQVPMMTASRGHGQGTSRSSQNGGMRQWLHGRMSSNNRAVSVSLTGSIMGGAERHIDGWLASQQGCCTTCAELRQQMALAHQQLEAAVRERDEARSQLLAVMDEPLKVPAIMAVVRKNAEVLASQLSSETESMLRILLRQLQELAARTDDLSQGVTSVDDRLQLFEMRQQGNLPESEPSAALQGVQLSNRATEHVVLDTSTSTQDLLAALAGPNKARLQQQQQQQLQHGPLASQQGGSNNNGTAHQGSAAGQQGRRASVSDHRQSKNSRNIKRQSSNNGVGSMLASVTWPRQKLQQQGLSQQQPSPPRHQRSERRSSMRQSGEVESPIMMTHSRRRSGLLSQSSFVEAKMPEAPRRMSTSSSSGMVGTVMRQAETTEVPRAPLTDDRHPEITLPPQPETEVLVGTAGHHVAMRSQAATTTTAVAAAITAVDSQQIGCDDVAGKEQTAGDESGRSGRKTVRRRRSALDLSVLVSKKSFSSVGATQGGTGGPSAPHNAVQSTAIRESPQSTVLETEKEPQPAAASLTSYSGFVDSQG